MSHPLMFSINTDRKLLSLSALHRSLFVPCFVGAVLFLLANYCFYYFNLAFIDIFDTMWQQLRKVYWDIDEWNRVDWTFWDQRYFPPLMVEPVWTYFQLKLWQYVTLLSSYVSFQTLFWGSFTMKDFLFFSRQWQLSHFGLNVSDGRQPLYQEVGR